MKHFIHVKQLGEGDRVLVKLSDGYVGKATVVKHTILRLNDQSYGYMRVRYDDRQRRLRTIDDWLAIPLDPLDLLAELG
jgi:hypothetical protein